MKKILFLSLALTLSVGLWAETQTVSYRYPVYNTDGDAKSGIKEWKTGSVEATEITNASATLAAGWYVVKGTDVQTGTLTCQGAVHLILADGAKLTVTGDNTNHTPGIQVSGTGNSLTIYAQSTGNQMGQLFATGGMNAAGIGGGPNGSGSNIIINGGKMNATGTGDAAGIGGGSNGSGSNITINGGTVSAITSHGAGIGGGFNGTGSNITINGGTVSATGGENISGIGGGGNGESSNIFVATPILLRASNEGVVMEIPHFTGYDIAPLLRGKSYVIVVADKATAYAEGYNAGKAEGKAEGIAEAQDELPTDPEGTAGHTVTITKGDKTLILVNPDKVTYGKQE